VGTTVTLTATADSGFLFSGWNGGGCTVNSACAVVMSASLAVSSAFAASVAGKTYFVSPTGSDTSTGLSLASPFKTINKAVSVVNAGDVIEVRSGTYNENVVIRRPGAANGWITLRGYNGESAVIRGTSTGPSIYFYANACDESAIGSGSGNTDCQPMYWVIQNMVVQGSASGGGDGNAIKIDTPKVRLSNNKLCCAVADIVKLVRTSNDVEIRGNELWQDAAVTTPSSNAQAIDIVGADRSIVFGNYVHDVPDIGIYAKGNSRNTIFDSNVLVNIGSNALMLGQSTDADRLADGAYETYDGIVRNNVVVNGDWACLASSSSQNATFINNSCYNTGRVTHGSILLSNESEVSTRGSGIKFLNNIFYGSSNRPILKITSNAIADYSTLTFDYNIYYNGANAPTFSSSDNFSTPISFSAWLTTYQTLTGHVDHSKVTDPLFSTTTGGTPLTLSSGSPAINAGVATSLVPVDARNVARPQGAGIDIGAYEY